MTSFQRTLDYTKWFLILLLSSPLTVFQSSREQVKTMKIQAEYNFRPIEIHRQLQLWKRFGRLYLIVFVFVRNIIHCFNCKEFGHFAKECRKPKRVKDSTYHKEKMLLRKQAEKGVPLQVEQAGWLEDTDEEIDEQELESHYSFMAKIQERHHSEQLESISNTCVVEKVDSNVIPYSPDMCDNDIQTNQNAVECDDEHVALANLITNLKLDVDENKKIQKQLKKANTSLAHELKECKSILRETSRTLGESNSIGDSCLIALQNKQTKLETYKTLNDRTVDYDKLEHKLNETLGLLAQK
ncbi:reverse transcriptase domain-containing protein [Tanacetum coccineum]